MRTKSAVCALLASLAFFAVSAQAAPSFQHVMIVVLENTNYGDAVQQPFLKEFASRGALLTNYHAVAHPSQPNYVALTAGTHSGVNGDGKVTVDLKNIADLLDAKGKTWKAYAEAYPGGCFLGGSSGTYARKHVPFLSFSDITSDAARCAHVVDATVFADDVAAGTVPNYSFFTPDLNDDGHDTDVSTADGWLAQNIGPLLNNAAFMKGTLVVITFDENDFFVRKGDKPGKVDMSGNRVYAALVGDMVEPGSTSNDAYDHYSLLRTIEDGLGIGTLGQNDDQATPIAGVWK